MPPYLLFPPPGMHFPLQTSKDFQPYFNSLAKCSCSVIPSFLDSSLEDKGPPHGPTYPTPLSSLPPDSVLVCSPSCSFLQVCVPLKGTDSGLSAPGAGHRAWHTAGTGNCRAVWLESLQMRLGVRQTQFEFHLHPVPAGVTLGKSYYLSESQFLHLCKLLWGWNNIIIGEVLITVNMPQILAIITIWCQLNNLFVNESGYKWRSEGERKWGHVLEGSPGQ